MEKDFNDSVPASFRRSAPETARFGLFELNLLRPELRRKGRVINLPQQSLDLITFLVQSAGKVVTREELQKALWPAGTFVEFELALYTAVNRLRRDLGDSAAEPLFIATVPKRGYRFIAPVEFINSAEQEIAKPQPVIVAASPASLPVPQASTVEIAVPAVLPYKRLFFAAAAVSLLLSIFAVYEIFVTRRSKAGIGHQVYRYALQVPRGNFVYSLAISPNGDQVVYEAVHAGVRQLYRRYFEEADFRPVVGTEDGRSPFFSPDGQSLGFYAKDKLAISGPSGNRVLASFSPGFDQWDAVWGPDGYIYYNGKVGKMPAIWRVPATGGAVERILSTTPNEHGTIFAFPNQVLASPRSQMIYATDLGPLRRSLYVMNLSTRSTKQIVKQGVGGQLLPTGHLLYYWNDKLFAAPFDARSLVFTGTPVEVVKDVRPYLWVRGQASVSGNGTLAYLKDSELPVKRLDWVDSKGKATPLPIPTADYIQAEVSPDGRKLALVRREERSRWTVWAYDLQSGAWTRLLESEVPTPHVVWSPDSAAIITGSEQANADFLNLVQIPLAAPQDVKRLTEQPDFGQFPQTWSAKADAILFMEGVRPETNGDIMVLPLSGDRRPHPLVATPGWDRAPSFSPDGRFFAYESDVTGKPEIFVQGYDAQSAQAAGQAVQISHGGGSDPIWSADGSHIFYLDSDQNLMQAEVGAESHISAAKELIHHFSPGFVDRWARTYSLAPDGRFLVMRQVNISSDSSPEIQIVVNWFEELKQLSPVP